jgi:hypothetical protein
MITTNKRVLVSGLLLLSFALGGLAVAQIQGEGAPGKIPADFPKDIPIYKGATVTGFNPAPTGMPSAVLFNVLFLLTQDEKAAVLDFYQRELMANGWKLEKSFSESPDALQASQGDRKISLAVLTGGGTKIQLGYAK